jgi:DNA-binding protein YbaB
LFQPIPLQLASLTMKFSALSLLLTLGTASAFAPQPVSTQHSTKLNLFGGGKKDGGGKKPAPGMMDQLAMFKKAQEMATKKNKLDVELAEMDFEGVAADGKVKATFKFVPIKNPMDPNPDYEATSFEFDDEWYEAASPEELSTAIKESINDGIEKTNAAVTEKYQTLQGDLMSAFGTMEGEAPAPPS